MEQVPPDGGLKEALKPLSGLCFLGQRSAVGHS